MHTLMGFNVFVNKDIAWLMEDVLMGLSVHLIVYSKTTNAFV